MGEDSAFAAMRTALEAIRPGEVSAVGFALLDTLLLPRVDLEAVKDAVARALCERLRGLAQPPTLDEVRARRSEVEATLAGDGDMAAVPPRRTLEAWVGTWLAGPELRAATEELRSLEARLMGLALCPHPDAVSLLSGLRARGLRVLFLCDTPLAASDVRALLANGPLGGLFDALYTSGDVGRGLIQRVLDTERLRPEQFLLVGPEEALAQARGSRTVRFEDPTERKRRARLRSIHRLARANPYWSLDAVEEVLRSAPGHLRPVEDDTYRVGRLLAPSLVAFVLDVLERSERLGLERLFFLSREGLTFLRILGILHRAGAVPRMPEVRYLFASRASTILASMREWSWEELYRFWRQYDRQSLRSLLRNLSLPEQEFLPLATACGLVDADRPLRHPNEDVEFARFLSYRPAYVAFARHRDGAREALREYLAGCGMFGPARVGLVDIGWKGSMQDNLVRAMESVQGWPEVHGFYLACTDTAPEDPRSRKYGFLADLRRKDLEEDDLFRNTAIFEMATQAHHGSTVRYAPHPSVPGRRVPVLVSHELERDNSERHFRLMQRAIFDYAHDFAEMRELLPYTAEELRPGALAAVLRYTRYPTREEAEAFLRYSHVESFGVHEVTTFGLRVDPRKLLALRHPRRMLGEIRRAFWRNPWRDGVVRRSGVPLGNWLHDAYCAWLQVR
jgi:FMN phosphatase YigB (HAD superfamily)